MKITAGISGNILFLFSLLCGCGMETSIPEPAGIPAESKSPEVTEPPAEKRAGNREFRLRPCG